MVLTKFKAVLEQHKADLDQSTYWRYRNGKLPQVLSWLASRPDLAQALAQDAIELAQERAARKVA